ncbi:MAG: hypothetical protein WCI77_07680 [Candidatus Omnitrophota bacterium]
MENITAPKGVILIVKTYTVLIVLLFGISLLLLFASTLPVPVSESDSLEAGVRVSKMQSLSLRASGIILFLAINFILLRKALRNLKKLALYYNLLLFIACSIPLLLFIIDVKDAQVIGIKIFFILIILLFLCSNLYLFRSKVKKCFI